jgi:hypothetical protein
LRRSRNIAASNASKPIAPRETLTPIPAFAPEDRVLDDVTTAVWKETGVVGDVAMAVGVDNGFALDIAEVEIDVVDEDALDVGEAEVDAVLEVATSIFHPTTAIAPTVELEVRVVVTVVHGVDSPNGVDAYVKVIPEDTSDKQSPWIWPDVPCAR